MKVIDLLNKIANGEHPKKFKLHIYKEDFIYELNDNGCYYKIETDEEFTESIDLIFCLNEEVEIIEDTQKEDKKIDRVENLNSDYYYEHNSSCGISSEEIILDIRTLKNHINQIIDYLIKSKGE